MERQRILKLYEWTTGICFRHPGKGAVPTALVAVLILPDDGDHEVRACTNCVITLEDMKREMGSRSAGNCQPAE
ncbi:hypothetical protein [Streptomyces prasinus]|uniref:hypothetical protein n=1 Tax=Streptomyces prasinus TaxID=67345 RepID=UPI0033A66FBC